MMKSTTIAIALLATIAVAKPHHGHHQRRHQHEHEKREIVIEWETAWVTETVIVDETGTVTIPAATPTSEAVTSVYSAAQFYETAAASSETPKVEPSSEAPPPPPPAPTTPTTYAAPAPPTTLIPTTKAAPTTPVAPPPPPPIQSTYVAPPPPPPPTTAEAPPPAPTVVEAPPPPKPQPTSYPAEGGSGAPSDGAKKQGDMTYYAPGMGSCGYDDSNPSMNVVAVSKDWFLGVSPNTNSGVNQPTNPLCDKTITISAKGKKTTAVIRDSCPGCTPTSIDVTEGAFLEIFGSLDVGRGEVTWWLNEDVPGAN
jgi:outer membrane biosynthesis protein TonB